VLDVHLGDDDGIALAEAVRSDYPHAVIIVISGNRLDPQQLVRVASVGRFVPKDASLLHRLSRMVS
jgi:CheY-like chemotaxis protein